MVLSIDGKFSILSHLGLAKKLFGDAGEAPELVQCYVTSG